jgi:hypothetical protein
MADRQNASQPNSLASLFPGGALVYVKRGIFRRCWGLEFFARKATLVDKQQLRSVLAHASFHAPRGSAAGVCDYGGLRA